MSTPAMRLAKQCADLGLLTGNIRDQQRFWSETAGLRLDHVLDVELGRRQYRYDVHGSVLKVNYFPDGRLPARSSGGYSCLEVADAHFDPLSLTDPDGNAFRRVPEIAGERADICVVVHTPDPNRIMDFYIEALGFEPFSIDTVLCGRSMLRFEEVADARFGEGMVATGYRYLTVQIFDADRAHRHVLARGGREGAPPTNLRDVARFSFVRDPDGNWIELSARASLIGNSAESQT